MKTRIANWGNFPFIDTEVVSPVNDQAISQLVKKMFPIIPRGLGRCYGDSALQKHILSTLKNNHFLAFDEQNGILHCEAGVSFDEILKIFVPKGWFLPVTPGTKFVTCGGALASDVHGKNHHKERTFSDHVLFFHLILPNGEKVKCSKTENTDLFQLTCGGMGLTGIITDICFRLKKIETAYIRQENIKAANLDEVIRLFEESENWTYSVAWIDCLSKEKNLGRSIMMRGENASFNELNSTQKKHPLKIHQDGKLSVPFYFPSFVLNSFSVKAFNFLYYHKQLSKKIENIVHYDTFYYPLDAIHHWNRIYGRNGFTQYQFVIPRKNGREGLIELIGHIGKKKMGSFLTVLKLFGKQDENYIRFPMEGWTLAMDFKIQPSLWKFLDEMDELVLKYGGRVYLTKDVRMNPEFLLSTYPQAGLFIKKIQEINSGNIASLQSQRLSIV
jgi:decaprenylphospho-beta-D-ribofuranose 2-oxidase